MHAVVVLVEEVGATVVGVEVVELAGLEVDVVAEPSDVEVAREPCELLHALAALTSMAVPSHERHARCPFIDPS